MEKNIIWGWVLIFFVLLPSAKAQSEWKDMYNQGVDIIPSLSINNDFNTEDWYCGFAGGIEDLGYQWGVRLGFELRPFRKRIQVLDQQNVIRQYHERKYFIFIDADKRFGHFGIGTAHLQFFAGGRGGLLMGNYSGTKNDAENYWVLSPFGGLCLNINDQTFIKLGYQYFNDHLLNVDDGRINLMIVFGL